MSANPISFERVEMRAGPRDLPAWARDLHVNFRHGWGNRPEYKIRCRTDPLAFTDNNTPVWLPFDRPPHARGWIAERDGVASVHYHGGALSIQSFEDHVRWITPPTQANAWKGEAETRRYEMLATTKQEGYGGRAFDITLDACRLPVSGVATDLPSGTPVRLRGPWHGGAPEGFMEVRYDLDREISRYASSPRWRRPWFQRGGYFGLYIRPEVFLDIAATYQPHLEWAWVTETVGKTDFLRLEPLVPQTGLPKGMYVNPADCPGHDYARSGGGTSDHPFDRCKFCGEQREPGWVYVSPWAAKAAA